MPRLRSPKYPSMPLDEAIERVERIFSAERQNGIARETAAQLIGYSGSSGASEKALGSIIQYGLLDRTARGEVQVSDLAVELIHPETDQSRYDALQRAASHPPIFAQLFQRYPAGYPLVDAAITAFLVRNNFTNAGVQVIHKTFKSTSQLVASSKPEGIDQKRVHEGAGHSQGGASKLDDDESSSEQVDQVVEAVQSVNGGPNYDGYNEWLRTQVAADTEIILIAKGAVNSRSLRRFIKVLETHLEFLEEDEEDP